MLCGVKGFFAFVHFNLEEEEEKTNRTLLFFCDLHWND